MLEDEIARILNDQRGDRDGNLDEALYRIAEAVEYLAEHGSLEGATSIVPSNEHVEGR